jgi:hypothetical protein
MNIFKMANIIEVLQLNFAIFLIPDVNLVQYLVKIPDVNPELGMYICLLKWPGHSGIHIRYTKPSAKKFKT